MSIIKLQPENFQTYRLIANPRKTFHSKSDTGVTGSIALFTDASPRLKEVYQTFGEADVGFTDDGIEAIRELAFGKTGAEYGSIAAGSTAAYMTLVNSKSQGAAFQKRQEVLRFIPGARLDKNHGIKNTVRKVLFPHYQYKYRNLEWGYSNYNSIHFFKSDNTPSKSALIYPAGTGTIENENLNYYAPSSSFTFDFYVKPKVNLADSPGADYKAGTILHMSSCYAISLVSGSSKGPDGLADKFRILFQLSQSADIPPSECVVGSTSVTANSGDGGFLFASSDNTLNRDEWHHISIRWPGSTVNGGTGSIDIDGVNRETFSIASASCMQSFQPTPTFDDPNAVFVGNYYEGNNTGNQAISLFFNPTVSENQGLTPFVGSADQEPSAAVQLRHQFVGELHDIKIYNTHKSDAERDTLRTTGITSLTNDLLFYVPPYFTQESRTRDILQTPFFDTRGTSEDPFNVAMSFGVGGLEINLENFCREFVRKEYPRLYNMTSSRVDTSVYEEGRTSNDILYSSGSAINRLYSILPCDNGKFVPSFSLLETGSLLKTKFTDSFGGERLDMVYLGEMVSTDNLPEGLRSVETLPTRSFTLDGHLTIPTGIEGDETLVPYGTGSFLFDLQGAAPEDPSVDPGNILTILQRTGDPSSNEIVFFDASNIFYGDRIMPKSLLIEDLNPSGSNGAFKLTLRDDGLGSIYRSDTPIDNAAKWSSVGNIFYEDGIIVVKSPHLGFFGKEEFKITMEGERSVYVFEVSIPVVENLHNSSSNPQYKDLKPTPNYNETANRFTYLTGIQLHDDNLNVIGRAHLAQPYVKREGDRVVIKLRMDY